MLSFAQELFTLDPTISNDSTPVGQFRLNYATLTEDAYNSMKNHKTEPVDAFYFLRSEEFFTIRINAVAKDNNQSDNELPIDIRQGNNFSLTKHAAIVTDHTELYKRKASALISNDKKMWGAILIAIIAPSIPFVPFIGLLALPAWIAAFYFLNQRTTLNNEYKDARTLLIATCSWALGPNHRTEIKRGALTNSLEINSMMEQLYPVLSKTQVKHLIADDIEAQYINALDIRDSRTKLPFASFFNNNPSRASQVVSRELEKTALKQRGAEVVRCIYGHNRGEDEMDMLRVITNFICVDIGRAMSNAVTAYYTPENAVTEYYTPELETTHSMG